MLADATMPSSAEGLIHALCSLADESITIVRLLSGQVLLEGPSSLTIRVDPTIWVPLLVVLPDFLVNLCVCRGSGGNVTLGDDIMSIFRRGGNGTRDNNVGNDHALCLGERREGKLS